MYLTCQFLFENYSKKIVAKSKSLSLLKSKNVITRFLHLMNGPNRLTQFIYKIFLHAALIIAANMRYCYFNMSIINV